MALVHSRRPSMTGSEASAANHRPGDLFGAQTRCEPNPNINQLLNFYFRGRPSCFSQYQACRQPRMTPIKSPIRVQE